jgi:hypothetical protein
MFVGKQNFTGLWGCMVILWINCNIRKAIKTCKGDVNLWARATTECMNIKSPTNNDDSRALCEIHYSEEEIMFDVICL